MNKGEVVRAVAEATGVPIKTTKDVVNSVFDTIIDAMAKGENVQVLGFGSFILSHKNESTARNIQTGEPIKIPEHNAVRFKPSAAFKEAVY